MLISEQAEAAYWRGLRAVVERGPEGLPEAMPHGTGVLL